MYKSKVGYFTVYTLQKNNFYLWSFLFCFVLWREEKNNFNTITGLKHYVLCIFWAFQSNTDESTAFYCVHSTKEFLSMEFLFCLSFGKKRNNNFNTFSGLKHYVYIFLGFLVYSGISLIRTSPVKSRLARLHCIFLNFTYILIKLSYDVA